MEGVGPATVRRVSAELGLDSPDSALLSLQRFLDGEGRLPAAAQAEAAELRQALAECAASDQRPPAEQVERLHPFCALVFPNRYDNAAARLSDLDQLSASAAAYGNRSRFLAELTLDPPGKTSDRAGPPHLDDDWLTLSTIHSAKGLEWGAVHVIHAADGNIPSDMAIRNEAGLAEEMRLMYVALTRAKDELTVHAPLRFHVNRFGHDDRHLYAQVSRFLDPVRSMFDEQASAAAPCEHQPLELDGAGVTDTVDALLASLWD